MSNEIRKKKRGRPKKEFTIDVFFINNIYLISLGRNRSE
jgi:hypothetical protein